MLLSVYDDEQYLYQALRAGAAGYLLKHIGGEELVRHLELARPADDGRRRDDGRSRGGVGGPPGARRVLARRAPGPDPARERGARAARRRAQQPRDRRGARHRRGDGQEPRALAAAQAAGRGPHRRRRRRAAGGGVPVTTRGLGLADPERENAVLLAIIEADDERAGRGAAAAAVARVITGATATDVCFVHVLDDTERSLTLAGATPPFDAQVGRVRLPLDTGVTGWVASHRDGVIPADKHADPRYVAIPELRGERYTSMLSVPMESEPAGTRRASSTCTAPRAGSSTSAMWGCSLAIGRLVALALHQARMHRRLAVREEAHGRFAEQMVAAQEAERQRLARDIHDGISQRLATPPFHLDAVAHPAGAATRRPRRARTSSTACDLVAHHPRRGTRGDRGAAPAGARRPGARRRPGAARGPARRGASSSTSTSAARPSTSRSRCPHRPGGAAERAEARAGAGEVDPAPVAPGRRGVRLELTDDGVGSTRPSAPAGATAWPRCASAPSSSAAPCASRPGRVPGRR